MRWEGLGGPPSGVQNPHRRAPGKGLECTPLRGPKTSQNELCKASGEHPPGVKKAVQHCTPQVLKTAQKIAGKCLKGISSQSTKTTPKCALQGLGKALLQAPPPKASKTALNCCGKPLQNLRKRLQNQLQQCGGKGLSEHPSGASKPLHVGMALVL